MDMENVDYVVCGYVVEDKTNERFFDFVTALDPQIKKFDDYFEELGYRFRKEKIVVTHGDEFGGIDFCKKTLVGIELDFNSTLNEKEVKTELSCFEKYLNDDEKNLVFVWEHDNVDYFSEQVIYLDKESMIYQIVDTVVKHINKTTCLHFKIKSAKKLMDISGENVSTFEVAYDEVFSHEDLFNGLRNLFELLRYEFEQSSFISITNEPDNRYITFEVKGVSEKNYTWSAVKQKVSSKRL